MNHEWIRKVAKDIRNYAYINDLYDISTYCTLIEVSLDDDMQRRGREFQLREQQRPKVAGASNQNVIIFRPRNPYNRPMEGYIISPD